MLHHLVLRHCSACGDERGFEAPVCADGHEADCPELVCVDCGAALFAGAVGLEAVVLVEPPSVASAA